MSPILVTLTSRSDSDFERSNISLKKIKRDDVDSNSTGFDHCVRENEGKILWFSVDCNISSKAKQNIICSDCLHPLCYQHDSVLQKYAHIGLNQKLFRSTTLDIITRLLDNAAFVCVHLVGGFLRDFSEVRGLRSRGFQL